MADDENQNPISTSSHPHARRTIVITKILLIEDDPDDALLIRLALEEQGPASWFECVHAERLAQGLELARDASFDLAILDLTLPDCRGVETFTRFRRVSAALPVVILTGLDDEAVAIECLDQGAQDYLVKGRLGDGVLRRALQYALARGEYEDRMRRQVRCQVAVSDLGLHAVRVPDLDSLIAETLVSIKDCLEADIVLFEAAASPAEPPFDGTRVQHQATHDLSSRQRLAWEALQTDLEAREPGLFTLEAQASEHSALGVEVRFGHSTLGVIAALFHPPRVFEDSERAFLESIGHLMSLAVQKLSQEHVVRTQEIFFRTIADNLAEGVVIAGEDGEIVYSNPQTCSLLGVSRTYLHGRKLETFLVSDEHKRDARRRLESGDEDGRPLMVRLAAGGGQQRWVQMRTSRITQLSGERSALIALTDMTERRAMEDKLKQLDRLEAIGRLAGGISHDFNNLLTVINGNAELVLEALSSGEPLHQEVSEILSAGEDAADLIEQLLTYSRQRSIPTLSLSVNEELRSLHGLIRRMLPRDTEVAVDYHPDDAWIRAERVEFKRIIMNLVNNARDSMKGRKGRLRISAEVGSPEIPQAEGLDESRQYVVLALEDNGSGISEDVLPHIFEPFFTTKPTGEGTGLGLASVYGLVRQSGGTIVCNSTPNVGTRFELYFVRSEEASLEPSEAPEDSVASERRLSGCVLVVDDQERVRNLIGKILESFGLSVVKAADGHEALEILERRAEQVDLVLSDIAMPHLTGWQLVAKLRQQLPALPVILMTAHEEVQDEGLELAAGQEILNKPIERRRLHEVLEPRLSGQWTDAAQDGE